MWGGCEYLAFWGPDAQEGEGLCVATPVNRFARYLATPGVKTPSNVFTFPNDETGREGTSGRLPVYTAQVGYREHSLTTQDGRQRESIFCSGVTALGTSPEPASTHPLPEGSGHLALVLCTAAD